MNELNELMKILNISKNDNKSGFLKSVDGTKWLTLISLKRNPNELINSIKSYLNGWYRPFSVNYFDKLLNTNPIFLFLYFIRVFIKNRTLLITYLINKHHEWRYPVNNILIMFS